MREEGGGGVRREKNKENSFLGLEADELIFDRWRVDLADEVRENVIVVSKVIWMT